MFIEIIPASFNWIASGVYKGVEAGCAAAKNKHPFISGSVMLSIWILCQASAIKQSFIKN